MRATRTTIRNALLACALAALAAGVARAAEPEGAPVFEGLITLDSVATFLDTLGRARPAPGWVILDSSGGDVDAALKLAVALREHAMSVHVRNKCFSSCANYLFLAGRSKVIGAGAVVGWHGSPASEHIGGLEGMTPEMLRAFEDLRRGLVEREQRFLEVVHVDRRLLCVGDKTIEQANAIGWTMPARAMARFGVTDVVAEPGPAIPASVPGHVEPLLVIDPAPDCDRVHPTLANAHY